jgi:uncharacterized protein (DUF885 family)
MSDFRFALADLAANEDGLEEPARLHAIFDLVWAHTMEERPERATMYGWKGHDHRWSDWSVLAAERRQQDDLAVLDALEGVDPAKLDNEDDRLSLRLLRGHYELARAGHRFPAHLMPITKMTGPHHVLVRAIDQLPPTTGGLDDGIARLHGVSVLADQVIGALEDGMAAGLTPPRVTIEDVPDQLDALADVQGTPMLARFAGTEAEGDAREAFAEATSPALQRLARFLREHYLPACRTTTAWSDLPGGAEWYRHLVRVHTTTDLEPEEIHDIGHREVKAIRQEMDEVIASTGRAGSFEDFIEHLRTGDEFYVDSAEELLRRYRDICKRIDPELPRLFGRLPRLTYGVQAIPDHEAPTTTTAYYLPGSPDTGRPGWFMANTYDLRSRPTWEMEALTVHEAVPGHHLQITLASELEGLPEFRRNYGAYTAYVEGWGLYSERLGHDMGLYADAYSRFGALTYQMWRAVRLVVDTGLHALGWSRTQAIDFFRANSSKPLHDITVEVDRYIAWPGQALAYKIGEVTISRLRAEAEERLGPERFDIRAFHDTVLGAGALPLDVLEERVRGWIAEAAK